VPFIPINGTTMEDCVRLARRLGERVGCELGIPVFLYERAASHADHIPLEAIRRGGLRGLAFRMESDPIGYPTSVRLDCMKARGRSRSAPDRR
jgi:glutamate formiminotransferase/glutamate formiminotransferase/formiminotetrahydrofolate cyclodeaminase